jgi:hypothetical protein
MKQTTIGKRLTRWKMFLQLYNFTIIYTEGKNNVLADTLSWIYGQRLANTEAEIMEDPTINKSFSVLTFLLLLSSTDQYSLFPYPWLLQAMLHPFLQSFPLTLTTAATNTSQTPLPLYQVYKTTKFPLLSVTRRNVMRRHVTANIRMANMSQSLEKKPTSSILLWRMLASNLGMNTVSLQPPILASHYLLPLKK